VAGGAELQVATRGSTDGDIMETSVVTFLNQTGIKFKHVSYGPEPDYWSKVQALHATGQVADVLWASTGNLHNFANRGILAELDPLLYNADMLNAAGFKVTEDPDSLDNWTYDTLKEAAAKTTTTKDGRAETFGYSPGTDFLSFLDLDGLRGARLGVPRKAFFGYHGPTDAVIQEAIEEMARRGATIVDPCDLPHTGEYDAAEFEVLLYEFKAGLNAYLAGLG
jgi:hypothetical protein